MATSAPSRETTARDELSFAIVCDSSCDLDPNICQRMGVTLVSHRLTLFDIELLDRSMDGDDVAHMLATNARVRATAPGHGSFAAVYDNLIEAGYKEIVVACPSSKLLSTYEAARRAADEIDRIDVRVRVIDTRCISGQLALVVARLVLDRNAGVSAREAIEHISEVTAASRLWTLLPPTVDFEDAHVLGETQGLRRSFRSLRLRATGGWLLTTVSTATGNVEVARTADDLPWLAGLLARTVSLFSQEVGPLTVLELASLDEQSLFELRRPFDTNEFEKQVAGTLSLRPSTLTHMGSGSVGVAVIPQHLIDPTELAELLA